MKRGLNKLLLPAVILMLTMTACATSGINAGQINLISTKDEIQLGKDIAIEIEKEQPVLDNPELTRYVAEIGRAVSSKTGRQGIPYTFKIIESDEVNAFALPGGPVYVYTGLLKQAENEAELASVMGHEVAHVAARHSTEQLTKTYGILLVTQIILGDNPSATAKMAGDIAGSLGQLRFSRSDELEADRLGVHYMQAAGYDPNAMLSFQRKLGNLKKSSPSRVLNLLSTHPLSQDRINVINSEIAKLPPGGTLQYHTERYNRIVGRALR